MQTPVKLTASSIEQLKSSLSAGIWGAIANGPSPWAKVVTLAANKVEIFHFELQF